MKKTFRLFGLLMVAVIDFGMTACGSDDEDDGIDTSPISLIAGKDHLIEGADTISSSNKFVAYGSGSTLHAWHVGETSVMVNGKKTISVSVLPLYHLYDDPICEWGCSKEYVKSHQKQGTMNSKSTNDIIGYDDAGAATLLAYSFKNDKLTSAMAVVSTNHTSQYASYLAERYLMLPYYKGEDTYFIGADGLDQESAKTVVVLQVYNYKYLATLYMQAKDYTTRSIMAVGADKSEALKLLESLMTEKQ